MIKPNRESSEKEARGLQVQCCQQRTEERQGGRSHEAGEEIRSGVGVPKVNSCLIKLLEKKFMCKIVAPVLIPNTKPIFV